VERRLGRFTHPARLARKKDEILKGPTTENTDTLTTEDTDVTEKEIGVNK
jgi:hypothetical protein